MSIVLFAIIGATIKAGVWYWVCFAVYCLAKVKLIIENIVCDQIADGVADNIKSEVQSNAREILYIHNNSDT